MRPTPASAPSSPGRQPPHPHPLHRHPALRFNPQKHPPQPPPLRRSPNVLADAAAPADRHEPRQQRLRSHRQKIRQNHRLPSPSTPTSTSSAPPSPPRAPTGNDVGPEVSDNGFGMRPDTVARIFAPFSTTKFLPSPPRSLSSREPGLSGEQPLRRLRAIHPTPRAIVMSGYREPDTRRRCADLGGHEFIAKPFERAALLVKFPCPPPQPRRLRRSPPLP